MIILVNLYLRSLFDIGPDTAIYLDVGQKLANGKKYFYYNFIKRIQELNFELDIFDKNSTITNKQISKTLFEVNMELYPDDPDEPYLVDLSKFTFRKFAK